MEKKQVKKVIAIHDMAGYGRCSLSIIMPILSVMGVQCCPVPTAFFSTHTGGYEDFYFQDMTESMVPYYNHWHNMNLSFDCVYSGFIGSEKQVEIIRDIMADAKAINPDVLLVVDPVMADEGKLYSTYTLEMVEEMRQLCEGADLITPNYTETCLLLEKEYKETPLITEEITEDLKALTDLGAETAIMTGLLTEEGYVNAGYSARQQKGWIVPFENVSAHYPGTGDSYTSILIGSMLTGESLPEAMTRASQFISEVVQLTYDAGTPVREGVIFEKILWKLKNNIEIKNIKEI
jgi:pyridoxine kinase